MANGGDGSDGAGREELTSEEILLVERQVESRLKTILNALGIGSLVALVALLFSGWQLISASVDSVVRAEGPELVADAIARYQFQESIILESQMDQARNRISEFSSDIPQLFAEIGEIRARLDVVSEESSEVEELVQTYSSELFALIEIPPERLSEIVSVFESYDNEPIDSPSESTDSERLRADSFIQLEQKIASLEKEMELLSEESLRNPNFEIEVFNLETEDTRRPRISSLDLGAQRFCALSRSGTAHISQACTCQVQQTGPRQSSWNLGIVLDERAQGRCRCSAICIK